MEFMLIEKVQFKEPRGEKKTIKKIQAEPSGSMGHHQSQQPMYNYSSRKERRKYICKSNSWKIPRLNEKPSIYLHTKSMNS